MGIMSESFSLCINTLINLVTIDIVIMEMFVMCHHEKTPLKGYVATDTVQVEI